jgi:tetratricopeptide (TPR) repeat protein
MQQAGGDRRILLEKAHELYLLEASRNPKSFKPYSSLAKVCLLEAQNGKKDALSEAIVYYQQAIERYPGKASLHVALGRCFEQMGNDEQAMNHFREAWQIEELFDKKFRKMYPGIEPVSRLNKEERRTVDEALGQ